MRSGHEAVEQALSVLGLAELPAGDQLKRAYLRAAKLHPPERDPDGFKQVRAAYDLLSTFSASHLARAEIPNADLQQAPQLADRTVTEVANAPPEPDPTEEWERRAEAIRANGTKLELVTLLREGEASGVPGFLFGRLLETGIEGDADLIAATSRLHPREQLSLAVLASRTERPESADRLVESALERMHGVPDTWATGAILEVVLTLCENAHPQLARGVFKRFDHRSLMADQLGAAHTIALRELLGELLSLPVEFPTTVFVPLARSLRNQDFLALEDELRAYGARDRKAGGRAAGILVQYAPSFVNPWVYVLDPTGMREVPMPPQPVDASGKELPNPTPWHILLPALGAAAILFLLAGLTGHCNQQARDSEPLPQFALPGHDSVELLCGQGEVVCLHARRVSVALVYHKCSEAVEEQTELEIALADTGKDSAQTRAALEDLFALVASCR